MSRQCTTSAVPKSKTLDNKYMLGDEIGKGAYGRVYKGLDLENGDFVAIKQVSLENIAQEDLNIIMQEIDLLKNLRHKNIVKYLGSSKTKSHLHIILEYVENGSLANIIKPTKFGPFPESLVAVYIAQVLEGLVYLHEQGVIHRDIKGANILLTKEGLVKLADFGVATKLTEADASTTDAHCVVGTPYWMAPEVIEMSGVCAASDIWSVGCTVIELLTCVPPYYELQPMPALFRIVQDERPPIPDSLSPAMTDFLCQCFKKDARQRADARTLLSHPWIQNSRRVLQSSLRHSGTLRNEENGSINTGTTNEDDQRNDEDTSTLKAKDNQTDLLSQEANAEIDNSSEDNNAKHDPAEKSVAGSGDDILSDQVPTLTLQEKLPVKSSSNSEAAMSPELHEPSQSRNQENMPINGELGSPNPRKKNIVTRKAEVRSSQVENGSSTSAPKSQDYNPKKVPKALITSGGNELSKFSDTPGDASLEDLFRPLDKTLEDHAAEASTFASSSKVDQGNALSVDEGRNVLATKLRAAIAKKRMEHESGRTSGGDLLRIMMGVLKEDATNTDGLVRLGFDDQMPADNLFHLQAVEFSKLVSSLRPDEPEDVVVSACQKLNTFFDQRPDQKYVFITQHGLLPLMELLEVPRPGVMFAVLQVLNQIIKDNTDHLENACLVGFVPVVMSFAEPDHPREIRMEAAYFLQQLCHSSSLNMHMFIACRGIPVLVGFLEADYAKYREMVHLAIDGIWKVLKLQRSPRNDFCRIAAKNGILPRLTNTLYSLNEATRLALVSSGGEIALDGITLWPRSNQLDPGNPTFVQNVAQAYGDHPDYLKVKHGVVDDPLSSGTHDSSRASDSRSSDSRSFPLDSDRPQSSTASMDGPITTKLHELSSFNKLAHRTSTDRTPTSTDGESNGHFVTQPQQDNVRLSNEKKTNSLDLIGDFAGHGREHANLESTVKSPPKIADEGTAASTSELASQTISGVLSGSGVLNARPGSASSSGLLSQPPWSADVTWEYVEKVADLLLEFAGSDTAVKSYMCSQSLLTRLFLIFNKIEPAILLKLLKCVNHLSTDPHCLENLQRADAIRYLIPNLEFKEGPLVSQIHHEVLNALFNLCKINKRRQEQAAENGVIPHLMYFIMSASPLKQYALPLLCDMAHASRNAREQLISHGGLDVYLSLLDDELWSVTALDSIAICLAHDNDNKRVEQSLLKKEAVQKLVNFFRGCPEQHFLHILEPFLKIITKSSRINTTLAVNGLTPLLILRLEHQDAITRLNLLKLIKAVYEHHPRPKQMIVENDLPQKLQNLIEERRDGQSSGGQVLVKQMATSLLKALHINTVL
ncbi:MAP3K epsilon protein kinase 1-like isoform X4 [Daucus carota subsp. sativus]|uniref:MAP3K epsilon protein kinase 1-like isoform X4 n=1 Tax=Daucus carota subsp. sativus TaxID=79200 RepID=UPI0007EF5A0C|nr:PREDICTED: MAP3K epsilon protein kinase 1-like isoform X4 [Daucus carota subsp. sativus]